MLMSWRWWQERLHTEELQFEMSHQNITELNICVLFNDKCSLLKSNKRQRKHKQIAFNIARWSGYLSRLKALQDDFNPFRGGGLLWTGLKRNWEYCASIMKWTSNNHSILQGNSSSRPTPCSILVYPWCCIKNQLGAAVSPQQDLPDTTIKGSHDTMTAW